MPHLRRWRSADMAVGITSVVHYKGERVRKLRRSWESVAKLAGSTTKDGPHILRHTAATWMMRSGVEAFEASGFLGMSPEVLWDVYGHHHPNFQASAAAATGKREHAKAQRAQHLPSNLPSGYSGLLASGARGREFESRRSDQFNQRLSESMRTSGIWLALGGAARGGRGGRRRGEEAPWGSGGPTRAWRSGDCGRIGVHGVPLAGARGERHRRRPWTSCTIDRQWRGMSRAAS